MTYAPESVAAVWDEAWLLMQANAAESGAPGLTFQPNRTQYLELERLGITRCYTARHEGRLAGYALFLISYHPQYAERVAMQEVLYLSPLHRGLGAGRFLLWTEDQLQADGVQAVIRHVVTGAPDYGRSLARLGYTPFQTAYLKRF